ncbi:RAD52 DNA repair protein RADC [Aspergillus mulundensis]|uniref:RAD52 homolog n=1 Tax=Aspergillus mulundensis TaxID=1810919 RepID=A0A3D8Q5P9_9EURO|nr:DNA repair and recombination protein radC [Aspergillus mulundensis]RDW57139.1 DNA repair and recombination protein radC [Aspergillus mulundensis]
MPAVGDQHRGSPTSITMPDATGVIAKNPFNETPARSNQYTREEVAVLQARLEKKLGPEYISSRPGAAGLRVHYLAADKCISLANEVLGFNGWSSSIQNIQIDFVDESPNTGKVSLGLSVIVRVTLKDGAYHEDVGYGHMENCKGKAAAFEKAKKEATTDALKRALRNFGNVLGNCVYDKDFISKVSKLKTVPTKLDVDDLHRHPDFAPIKREPVQPKPPPEDDDLPPRPSVAGRNTSRNDAADVDAEFGSDVFDEADFNVGESEYPDEIVAEDSKAHQPPTPITRPSIPPNPSSYAPGVPSRTNPNVVTPSKPERPMHHAAAGRPIPNQAPNNRPYPPAAQNQNQCLNQRQSVPPPDAQRGYQNGRPPPPGQRANNGVTTAGPGAQAHIKQEFGAKRQNLPPQNMAATGNPGIGGQGPPVVGFFSARGVDMLRDNPNSAAAAAPAFDPHAESPSIRKTAGVDHTKSVPISKPMLTGSTSPAPNQTRDFINPSSDMHRKLGAPGGSGTGSPMNRGPSTSSYRPLTRPNIDPKTAAPNNVSAANRSGFGPANMNGKRPPLNDVTNASVPGGDGPTSAPGFNDPKRARYDGTMAPQQQQQQQSHQR